MEDDDFYKETEDITPNNRENFTLVLSDIHHEKQQDFSHSINHINFTGLYTTEIEQQILCLQNILSEIYDGFSVSDIPKLHLLKIFDFIIHPTTKEQGIITFSILKSFLSLEDDLLHPLYDPNIFDFLLSTIENTENEDFLCLAIECIDSLLFHKKIIKETGITKELVFIEVIHSFESVGHRFPISEQTDHIISNTFKLAKTAIKTFADEINKEYNETKQSNEQNYQFFDDFLQILISYGHDYINGFTYPVLEFLLAFFKVCPSLANDTLCNQQFLTSLYEFAYSKTPLCDLLLFELTDTILNIDPNSSVFILDSKLINELSLNEYYDEEIQKKISKTLRNLVKSFVNVFHSFSNKEDIEKCASLIDGNWTKILETAYSVFCESSFDLKTEACYLICSMMDIGYPSSHTIIDNTENLIQDLIEMMHGKDRELDLSIIRAIQQILYAGDQEAQEQTLAVGETVFNRFLDDVSDNEFKESIDLIEELWEDDEQIKKAILSLKTTIEQYNEFAEIDQ